MCITFKLLEIGQHAAAQFVVALLVRHRRVEQFFQVPLKPLANSELAKVPERWIADVVHQTRHFHQAFQCAFQPIQAVMRCSLTKLLVQGAHDETARLLDLKGMRQTTAHRRIALQRKDLSLLLQPAHRSGVDDTAAIAFELINDQ